nr:unnamed protein product [Callosobruchus chinensis]
MASPFPNAIRRNADRSRDPIVDTGGAARRKGKKLVFSQSLQRGGEWGKILVQEAGIKATVEKGSTFTMNLSGKKTNALKPASDDNTTTICLNVYNGLLSSMQDSSKGSVLKKASQLTNVPYKTLYKIIRNGVKTRKKRSNFGKFKNLNPTTAAKIRNIVYDCYKKRQIPTAEIPHRTLLEKGENSSRRTLQRWLRKIGFRFGTIDKKDAIVESRREKQPAPFLMDDPDPFWSTVPVIFYQLGRRTSDKLPQDHSKMCTQ